VTREAPRSEKWLARVPFALIEHPFACLMALWGVLSGVPILFGVIKPSSVINLLPPAFVTVWTSMLVLASLSIAWGLIRHRYSTTMARGLQLLAVVVLVYAVAIMAASGWVTAIPGSLLLVAIAALCYLRGWYLRTQAAIQRRTFTYADGVEKEMARREAP
jgi:hypothetical protein